LYLTIMHGHVNNENWQILEESFANSVKHPPEGLMQSLLTHCEEDQSEWKIVSLWRSEESYTQAKAIGQVDTSVELFCDDGTTPERRHYHVVERYMRVTSE
jgi:hypothetical protein